MGFFSHKKAQSWNTYLDQTKTDLSQVGDRAKERMNFIGITEEVLSHVKEAAVILSPYKQEMMEMFYSRIQSLDHLNQIINHHSTIDRLKKTMAVYIDQFLQAEVNHDYIMTRITIGQVHSRINLTPEHFVSAHHLLIQIMTSILMEKLHKNQKRMMECVISIQKLAAYDQQLIIEVYMEETVKHFLFDVSDMLNQTTGITTTKQLVTSMEKQIEETYSVTAATEEMGASIQEVSNYAVKVAEGTEDAVKTAIESKQVVDGALEDIQKVGHVYEVVVDTIAKLALEIEHTQNVVNVINEIADQTNLLALNASIEAARAGEHGRGFAVVANEVRKLSEHTKEQITQITSNIHALQNVSSQVIQQIRQTGKMVEQSVSGSKYAGEALSQIVTVMKEINESTSQIAAMSEEQTSAVLEIAERNTIINDYSQNTQDVALNTAQTVFDLSSKMDDYRKTFFDVNIKLGNKDIVRVAKTDHLLWKWKIYNMILGVADIDSKEVTSHELCRLGKWYYGDLNAKVKSMDAFKKLEAPHKDVHHYAKLAVDCHNSGDNIGVEKAFEQLEHASNIVLTLLTELEKDLK